ncbi:MAG: FIST C-terminal domain-containing protein [Bacteroidia bacterium]|nr:FIST C-terminal domain-containing protein [Bacteroidia bacterium]
MRVSTGFSQRPTVIEAVAEVKRKLSGCQNPKLVMYFSSMIYPQTELALAMKIAFPEAETFGCTTAGELSTGYMGQHSLVALAADNTIFEDVFVTVIENISSEPSVSKSVGLIEQHFGTSFGDLDFAQYGGFIFTDGMSLGEEKVMDKLGDLTNITIIGGSSGDDLQFKETYIFANGFAHKNASVLAVFKAATRFEVLKTQSFDICEPVLTATKVDEASRKVLEFNGKPATVAYAEAIGTNPENLSDFFMSNPLGLVSDGDPYVRSPQQIQEQAVCFYCQVLEGMELSLLQSRDIVQDTRRDLNAKIAEFGPIACLFNFHCILRTLELRAKKQEASYATLFNEIPTIGFSTYGESYVGHINQTSTMLVFA